MTNEQERTEGQPDNAWREQLGARSSRRPTFLTGALALVVVAAVAFAGGIFVEKGRGGSTAAASGPAGFPTGGAGGLGGFGGAPGGGRFGGAPTVGTIESIGGGTMVVREADGSTVTILTSSSTTVTSVKSAKLSSLRPGDTVSVSGTSDQSGAVTADRVTVGTSADLQDLRGGFGGGAELVACLQRQGITVTPGQGFDTSDPKVQAALQECRSSVRGGAGGTATTP